MFLKGEMFEKSWQADRRENSCICKRSISTPVRYLSSICHKNRRIPKKQLVGDPILLICPLFLYYFEFFLPHVLTFVCAQTVLGYPSPSPSLRTNCPCQIIWDVIEMFDDTSCCVWPLLMITFIAHLYKYWKVRRYLPQMFDKS